MTFQSKLSIILIIFTVTLGYSHFKKKQLYGTDQSIGTLILKKLPLFKVKDVYTDRLIKTETLLNKNGGRGLVIHFWGTWCAPCEVELPSFIKLAKSFEGEGVTFLILAINDEVFKIKKFLKKFKKPDNVIFAFDNSSKALDLLGTVKVPETYLFNNKGKHLKKYAGPQEWEKSFYKKQIERSLLDTSAP